MLRSPLRVLALLLLLVSSAASLAAEAEAWRRTASGLVDLYGDPIAGRSLVGIRLSDSPLLLVAGLPGALGSNEIGLDRNQPGDARLVSFRRVGPKLLLVQHNTAYVADSESSSERAAVRDAFAEAILWAGPILGEAHGGLIVDLGDLLTSDAQGIASRLRLAEQGEYSLDSDRSLALSEGFRSYPDNAEFEALLTFRGAGEGALMQQVSADAGSVSLRQRISLVRLPADGFRPRPYHPASGAMSVSRLDFAQPLERSLEQRWQPRFRLEKHDPGEGRSTVVKPIVFYLDNGTPEPMRSALLEGANWWATAFDAAGFESAFRAELQAPEIDLMDLRVNAITWTHRATRGWSYGGGIIDPRSGEIIKGYVNLGSQRVRQDLLIAESLLAPFADGGNADLALQARRLALARLRQLSAHEVGHALGLAHNFAASLKGNGSVMDYPHPIIDIDQNDRIELADPYGIGVGPWDLFAIKHAYGQFSAAGEAAALAGLRREIADAGFQYISDNDARAPGDAHPAGILWDFGGDVVATYQKLLTVRALALANFNRGVVPGDRQSGELEARLVPLYLLHRYQTEAVARMLGGAYYRHGLAADASGTQAVDATTQNAALEQLLSALSMDTLEIPEPLLALLTPPGAEHTRSPEYFVSRSGPIFDPDAAVGSATALVVALLFDPARLNRLHWQHQRDNAIPSVKKLLRQTMLATWLDDQAERRNAAVTWSRNWVVLDAILAALEGGLLQPAVEAELRLSLAQLQGLSSGRRARDTQGAQFAQAANYLARYLQDPSSVKIRPLPILPPGAPI